MKEKDMNSGNRETAGFAVRLKSLMEKQFSMKAFVTGAIAILVIMTGLLMIIGQSTGYMVYYDDNNLGFIANPEEISNNITSINAVISENKDAEATVDESKFSFNKKVKVFSDKDSWTDIALAAAKKCNIVINIYDIYVNGKLVAEDSSIDGMVNAMSKLKKEYSEKYPDDKYDTIDFAQTVEVDVTKGYKVESMEEDEIYKAMAANLTVQTATITEEESVLEYDVIYKISDTLPAGTTKVESAGKKGVKTTVTKTSREKGKVTDTKILEELVTKEPVEQVVLVGTLGMGSVNESGFINPTTGTLTSRMGIRNGRMHKGIDIANSQGTPIYAAMGGTVIRAEFNNSGYGNMVKIDHGNGVYTLYGHMYSLSCSAGDVVEQGALLGLMGTTGRSTGNHLHFEVIVDGVNVDPLLFVNY